MIVLTTVKIMRSSLRTKDVAGLKMLQELKMLQIALPSLTNLKHY